MKPTAPSLAGLSQKCKLTCAAAAAGLLFAVSGAQAQALTPKQESIIPIAALTAEGDAARLKTVLADALNRKSMTVNEMKDVLLQMYAYTGFPRSLTGLGVLVNLLDERHAAGITDEKGREATPLPAGTNIRELGTKTQTELVAASERTCLRLFAGNRHLSQRASFRRHLLLRPPDTPRAGTRHDFGACQSPRTRTAALAPQCQPERGFKPRSAARIY